MDGEKIFHFINHILPNSNASNWLNTLILNNTTILKVACIAFNIRWPPPKYPKFSWVEQIEQIREQVLKEESIRKWVML